MKTYPDRDEDIRAQLELLQDTPARDPDRAAQGRQQYLTQMQALFPTKSNANAVSLSPVQRLNGWITQQLNAVFRKERYSMLSVMTTLVLVLTFVFGGTGATVYAAQDALPDTPLYALKLFTEDVQVSLQNAPEDRLNLALELSDRRVDEIVALTEQGKAVPQEVVDRLNSELDLAIAAAVDFDASAQGDALTAIAIQIRDMDQDMGRTGVDETVQITVMSRFRNGVQSPPDDTAIMATLDAIIAESATDPQAGTNRNSEASGPGSDQGSGPQAGPAVQQGPGPEAGPGSDQGAGPQSGPGQDQGQSVGPRPCPFGVLDAEGNCVQCVDDPATPDYNECTCDDLTTEEVEECVCYDDTGAVVECLCYDETGAVVDCPWWPLGDAQGEGPFNYNGPGPDQGSSYYNYGTPPGNGQQQGGSGGGSGSGSGTGSGTGTGTGR